MPVKSEDLGDIVPRPGETERQAKVRIMTERIRAEARKAREEASLTEAQREMKRKQSDMVGTRNREEEDGKKLETLIPQLEAKVSAVEEEAEKVSILAAPLAMEASEELKSLQLKAVRDTERAVKAAMGNSALAKRELDRAQQEVPSMAPQAQEYGREECEKFAQRLQDAQAKLDEHKNVRKDHEAALSAEKHFGDLNSRLAGVEMDCEKAAMMTEPLARALEIDPEQISAAEIRETKESLRVAQAALAPTMRLILGKVAGLKGPIMEKMNELKIRAETTQALVDRAQRTVEEAQSRVAVGPLLQEARDRAEEVENVLEQMRESEAPFLMGIECMPPDEADAILQGMDKAAAAAHTALADALKYIGLKIVEVGRLSDAAAAASRTELQKIKMQIEAGVQAVQVFQADSAKRRRANLVEVVKGKIEEAEAVVLKMKEAGGAIVKAEGPKLQEALEKALACELEAQSAVAMARRELQAKQQDIRPLEGSNPEVLRSSSEIMRTKVRVQYMEGELAKFRKLAKGYEEKIKVDRSLGELLASLDAAEADVEKLTAAAQEWPVDANPPEEDTKNILIVQEKLSNNITQVEMKLQNAQGLELKELRAIFGRLQKAQGKLDKVKETARLRSRSVASGQVKIASDAVKAAEAKVAVLTSAARNVAELPVPRLEALNADLQEATALISQALQAVAEGQKSNLEMQGKVEFARLQLRCKALERKGKGLASSIGGTLSSQAEIVAEAVRDALREALYEEGTARQDGTLGFDSDVYFDSLAQSGEEVTVKQVSDLLARRAGIGKSQALADDQVRLAIGHIAPHGLTKRAFASAVAEFMRVVREVTLTDDFQVSSASKVRKLEAGETVEVVGAVQLDPDLGLERAQCRAIVDGASGWVTIRSAQGTAYLQRSAKPFVWCNTAVDLRAEPTPDSTVVRRLVPGEALELLEGPREERLSSDLRVRGVTCDDEITGWLQVKDRTGAVLARPATGMYKCIEAIAMTDVADFENCTMVRRIDAGEALELLPDQPVQPAEGGQRRKFRACRDGREGWVTSKGSQGTVYVKAAQRHYVCVQASPVHVGLGAESAVSKVLMPGEAFAAFEDPKEVSGGERLTLRRGRAVADAAEGWLLSSTALAAVQEWRPRYKVLKATPLTASQATNEAAEVVEVVRLLVPGELVDAVDQPIEDGSTLQLRLRCVAVSDKAPGWATVREAGSSEDASSLLLRPITDEEDIDITTVDGEAAAPSTPPRGAPQARGVKRPYGEVKEEAFDEPGYKGKGYRGKGGGKGGRWSKGGKPSGKW